MMKGRIVVGVAVLAAAMSAPVAGTRSTFMPDWTFKGSTLEGWKTLGQANWTASNGEIVGTPKAPEGGWLVLGKSFQDVQFGADFRCAAGCKAGWLLHAEQSAVVCPSAAGCKAGVLFRAEKTADRGMKGIYVSLTPGETGSFAVTLDANGKELTRENLTAGGGMARFSAPMTGAAAAAGGN